MLLREMQAEHLIRLGLGADNSDEVFLFFSRPRAQSGHIGQDERKILEGCLIEWPPRRRADTQDFLQSTPGMFANATDITAKITCHPAVDSQPDVARREGVPCSHFASWCLIKHVSRRQALQGPRWRSVSGLTPVIREGDFLFFAFRQSL